MQAKDVMTTVVATIGAGAEVQEAARLMLERHVSALPVIDEKDRVIGIISEGDLVRRAELGTDKAHGSWWLRLLAFPAEGAAADFVKTHSTRVRDVMSSPVISVGENAPLEKIALLLEKHRVKRVPVLRAGQLVGIVSRADLVRRLAIARPGKAPAAGNRSLRQRMLKSLADAGVDATYLNVSVESGVLHVWGGVKSEAEKQALRVAAEGIPGVRKIEDHTFVMPPRLVGAMGGL